VDKSAHHALMNSGECIFLNLALSLISLSFFEVRLFSLVCVCVCVFITAVPITKLFAWGDGIVEDMCYERRRAEALVD